MEMKIKISTPNGMAKTTSLKTKVLKRILFQKASVKKEYVNKQNNAIFWIVNVTPREYPKLIRKIGTFKFLVKQLKKNHLAVKALKRMADTPEVYSETMNLLEDGTTIEIIKRNDEIPDLQ